MKLREIKITPTIVAISAMLLALTSAAAPKIVYVAPDGTGDGSSWENAMGSVSNAYASAAAFAEGGYDRGEVWVKRGIYSWGKGAGDKNIAIEMQSHVTVRGGFAGDETSADQARPDVNNSVISGDFGNNAVWCPNGVAPATADQVKIWRMEDDNPVLNEPDILPGTNYVVATKNINDCQNGFVARSALTDCEFNGVVLSVFCDSAISIGVGSTDIRIRRCKFVAGNIAQNSSATLSVVDTPSAVLDCDFICCWNAVSFSFNTVYGHTLFSNCVVRKCANSAFYVGQSNITALKSAADSSLTCKDCIFEYGYSGNGTPGLTLAIATAPCTLRVSDCIFRNNRMLGKFISNIVKGSDGLISTTGQSNPSSPQLFERCQFIGNRMEAEDGTRSACIILNGLSRNDCIRDCYFASNTVRHAGTAATGSAAVARVAAGNHYIQVINSTFEDNVASVANEGAFAGLFVWSGSNIRFGLINCVFRGSRLSSATDGYAAEVFGYNPAAAGTALIFGNTIFANDAEDYRFWNYYMPSGTTKPYVVGVAVPDLDKVDKTAFYGIASSITAADPKLANAKTGANGAVACGVGYDSAYAKNAYPVCMSADGNYCLFHTKESSSTRWRIAPTAGNCNDATAESTYGVTSAAPLIPDAFGAERTERRVAYGPLNAPVPGLMLLLR